MRRVRRASCGIWAATRHSRLLHGYAPLPTEGLERVGSVSGMMLQVCVNGARDIAEHPSLSTDPARVAAECAEAVSAGADAVHVHPKDTHGQDSLQNPDVGRWVRAVRAQCLGIPVGVTTGAWALPSVEDRRQAIAGWQTLPDFASVNWHEPGADQIAATLLDRGIGVEAGIWHQEGLNTWLASPLRSRCQRVLIEVQDIPAEEVESEALVLVQGVRRAEPAMPLLLHGEERSAWPALELAGRLGLDRRAGLEDMVTFADGRPAPGNAELITVASHLRRRSLEEEPTVMKPYSVPLAEARTAFLAALDAFEEGASSLDDLTLLGVSHVHGWSRLDCLVHVRLGLQEMLAGLAARTDDTPDVDAASYWTAVEDGAALDPVPGILLTRRVAAAYNRPGHAVRHLHEVVQGLRNTVPTLPDGPIAFQGHVLTAGDMLATWAVELAVHHHDLALPAGAPAPAPAAVHIGRLTAEALGSTSGARASAEDDLAVMLASFGRR